MQIKKFNKISYGIAKRFTYFMVQQVKHIPGKGVLQAMSFGSSNCIGFKTCAASARVCSGLLKVTKGAGGSITGGGVGAAFALRPELPPLLVEEASSSF